MHYRAMICKLTSTNCSLIPVRSAASADPSKPQIRDHVTEDPTPNYSSSMQYCLEWRQRWSGEACKDSVAVDQSRQDECWDKLCCDIETEGDLQDWKMTDRITSIRSHITLPRIYSANSLIITVDWVAVSHRWCFSCSALSCLILYVFTNSNNYQ